MLDRGTFGWGMHRVFNYNYAKLGKEKYFSFKDLVNCFLKDFFQFLGASDFFYQSIACIICIPVCKYRVIGRFISVYFTIFMSTSIQYKWNINSSRCNLNIYLCFSTFSFYHAVHTNSWLNFNSTLNLWYDDWKPMKGLFF